MSCISFSFKSAECRSGHHFPFRFLILTAALLVIWFPRTASGEDPATRYKKALKLARNGQLQLAIPLLKALSEEFPARPEYLYDYIDLLGWAEKDREVLSFRSRIDPEKAPPYLLETFGRSARNLHDYPLSVRYYELALAKAPDRMEGKIGLAVTYSESGSPGKGIDLLEPLHTRFPERLDIAEALAFACSRDGRYLEAEKLIDGVLRVRPADKGAKHQKIMLVDQMGAPFLAGSMAGESPGILTRDEYESIAGDEAAQAIRWGELYNPPGSDRYQDTDKGIRILEEQIKRFKSEGDNRSAAYHRAQFDLLEGLRDRGRRKEAIVLYRQLVSEKADIPDYAWIAAADAFSGEQQNEAARDIYRQVLKRNPDDFEARLSLFYTLFDLGDDRAAQPMMRDFEKDLKDPDRRLRAEIAIIKGEAWTGRIDMAEKRVSRLIRAAPNNPELRALRGYLYLWRGWPRKAEEEFRRSRAIEPVLIDARIGEVEAEGELNEEREEKNNLENLALTDPEDSQVRSLLQRPDRRKPLELTVSFLDTQNSGEVEGSRELSLDFRLYSKLGKENTRAFIQTEYNLADFPEGTGLFQRAGAGLEYRSRLYWLEGELFAADDQTVPYGAIIQSGFTPDDFWTFGAGYDSNSRDVPLRGRLDGHLDGYSLVLNADFRASESGSAGARAELLRISDDNTRLLGSLYAAHRLVTGPVYKLDAKIGLYGSVNSRSSSLYYDPSRDLSAELELINEWTLIRSESRTFLHRLGLMAGNYFESEFESKIVWGTHYEQEWDLHHQFDVVYGAGFYRPVYDGAIETSIRLTVRLDWRF